MARSRRGTAAPVVLVTGFEPYGGRRVNPSALIARALDGSTVDGVRIRGAVLPVRLASLDAAIGRVLRPPTPVAIVALGLAPGEAVIRLERFAANLADFELPDNDGRVVRGRPLDPGGGPGLWARLPLAAIQRALLKAGIPARLSMTAGTYLCNAAMYRLLAATAAADGGAAAPAGFVHLPLLPEQVAAGIAADAAEAERGVGPLPSMDLETQLRAVRIALRTTLAEGLRKRRRGAV